MDKIKVLVVDDHTLMRDGIRALVEMNDDIDVVGEASEGKEAIQKTQELAPDVIIMDIAMPGIDGLEATRMIKRQNSKAKILILTQYNTKEYMLAAIKAGASGYLPKRAIGMDLLQAIYVVHGGDFFLYPSVASALIDHYQRHRAENTDPYDRLTPRQREILKLIAEGLTSKEIADAVFLNLKTVRDYRTGIMKKLGLRNHTELIKYAAVKGLLNLST